MAVMDGEILADNILKYLTIYNSQRDAYEQMKRFGRIYIDTMTNMTATQQQCLDARNAFHVAADEWFVRFGNYRNVWKEVYPVCKNIKAFADAHQEWMNYIYIK